MGNEHRFGKAVVTMRIPILILGFLLLVPSVLGFLNTRVNYDLLTYLPKEIETMKGQDILVDQFGSGAMSLIVVKGMNNEQVSEVRKQIEEVNGVKTVIWYDSIADLTIPIEMLSDKMQNMFMNGDATLMVIIFEGTTSDDKTLEAVEEIRGIASDHVFLSGMSAVAEDTKLIANQETPVYVAVAGILTIIVLQVAMDNFLAPIFFLLSIGMSIIYNLGSNIVLGEISYLTKALAAVLQLGVTMDYSIFLWHSYEEYQEKYPDDKKRAMYHAIDATLVSVVGSSITSIAGFLALCFMSFSLGLDMGLVMAKGVAIGVIASVTILPSMILIFDKALEKTMHRQILPEINRTSDFVTKKYPIFIALFVILMIPALYGYTNYKVYYNLDETLPKSLLSTQANDALKENFDMNSPHMVLVNKDITAKDMRQMTKEIEKLDGVEFCLSLDGMIGDTIPDVLIPGEIKGKLESDEYKLMLIGTDYKAASDEVNKQCSEINEIIKSYDEQAMLIGEAAGTKDLIEITDKDFKTVSTVSIGVIFVIILILFKSISLPIILVSSIELAIFINMGLAYYTNTTLPFVASIVIGTIQLGATVDYAILMTTRYKKERNAGATKKEAIKIAHSSSCKSVLVSALSFFAATIGVALCSKIDMISSLCMLMSRGAIISMFVVIFILPSLFVLFDWVICHTSIGFGPGKEKVSEA